MDEIIAKQKSLEIKDKGNDTSLNLKKRVPKNSLRNVKTKQKKIGTSGKAEHLSISKQKRLGFQDRRTENVNANQKTTAAKSNQPAKPPNSHPPPISLPREKTKPNILSHNKSQTLAKHQGWYYNGEVTTVCAQHQSDLIKSVQVCSRFFLDGDSVSLISFTLCP